MKKTLYLILLIIPNIIFGQKDMHSIPDSLKVQDTNVRYVEESIEIPVADNPSEDIYTFVSEDAQFIGGNKAMHKYIYENLKYPKEAIEKKIEGRVIVMFVVAKTGDVMNVKILKGISPYLDKEALRLVDAMPKWYPAKINGRSVNQKRSIPINFTLK